MHIKIDTDFSKTLAGLDNFAYKQVPYASAVALTRLAKMSQTMLRSNLSNHFTLRSKWVEKGIVVQAAQKSDWPHQSAEVGSRDYFMAFHALGGIKKPKSGRNLALPQAIRQSKSDIIKKKDRPAALLRKKGKKAPYLFTSRRGKRMIVVDTHGPNRVRNFTRTILYTFTKQVQIKKDWPIDTSTQSFVQKNYDKVFGQELAKALATSKR